MDEQITAIHDTVKELQTTSKFVLKRLNQVLQQPEQLDCTCESSDLLQDSLLEIEKLKDRVSKLEQKEKEKEDKLIAAVEELNELQSNLEQLQLTVQTNDVTLKHDEVDIGSDDSCDNSDNGIDDDNCEPNITETEISARAESETGAHTSTKRPTQAEAKLNEAAKIHTTKAETGVKSLGKTGTGLNRPITIKRLSGIETKLERAPHTGVEMSDVQCNEESNDGCDNIAVGKSNVKSAISQDHTERAAGHRIVTEARSESKQASRSVNTRTGKSEDTLRAIGGDNVPRKNKPNTEIIMGQQNGPAVRFSGNEHAKPKENELVVKRSGPEVIHQTQRITHFGMFEWEMKAHMELNEGKQSGLQHLGEVHTVFLIDISASMEPAWSQVQLFFKEFISGLEDTHIKMSMNAEHVAIVTFGHETRVQLRLTNDFAAIRNTFDNLKLGGPSPLCGGMLMAIAAAGSSDIHSISAGGFHQGTKVILITDGEPTEASVFAGPDVVAPDQIESAKLSVVETAQKLVNWGDIELYIVPVGNANTEFLQFVSSCVNGKMLDYRNGQQFSRRLYLMLCGQLFLLTGAPELSDGEKMTEADKSDLTEAKQRSDEIAKEKFNAAYQEDAKSDLPVPGSRVRRGPDWEYNDQDSSGPGTVTGHTGDGEKCYVNWDADSEINHYRYGHKGFYDILLVDEPRQLTPGESIAVGCLVKPGIHWKCSNASHTQTGVVLRLALFEDNNLKALVRWDDGTRGDYTYDIDNNPEIEVCDSTYGDQSYKLQSKPTGGATSQRPGSSVYKPQHIPEPLGHKSNPVPQSSVVRRPVRNKNKNIK